MKEMTSTIFILLPLVLVGCGDRFDVYSPSQIHRTVQPHPNREGMYVVYYRWDDVTEKFGPGLSRVHAAVRQADDKDKLAVWDRAMETAVPKYLEYHGLVPSDCVHGIVVVSSNKDEAGGGKAAFRCK